MADVPRVKCVNATCDRQILPSTAEKNAGLCMPCKQQQDHLEWEQYVRENRRDVDLFAGVDNRAEIIKLMHQPRKPDPLINYLPYHLTIEQVYQQLTAHEERELLCYVEAALEQGANEMAQDIALELAAFRKVDLSRIQASLLALGEYYPAQLFKNADAACVTELLNRLENEAENRNHILQALAWNPCPTVVSAFASWRQQPPAWQDELYVATADYTATGGWQLASHNQVRKLFFEPCYPLLGAQSDENAAVKVISHSPYTCPICQHRLTNFLELDLRSSQLAFLQIDGEKLLITNCEVCACYNKAVYMQVDWQGYVRWSEYNQQLAKVEADTAEWGYLPENALQLATMPRAADYAVEWTYIPTQFSQLGGMPSWIQDTAYPDCPACHQTMKFIAQISNEDCMAWAEGIYYHFICTDCQISATCYQQT